MEISNAIQRFAEPPNFPLLVHPSFEPSSTADTHMKSLLTIVLVTLLSSCATNRLHFAPYTDAATLDRIRSTPAKLNLKAVSPPDSCSPCNEGSSAVWHAANLDGLFYEGFFGIPVTDWKALVATSLDRDSGDSINPGASIEVKRVFLKTWQQPRYSACLVEIVVSDGSGSRRGVASIKLPDTGQILISRDRVRLSPEYKSLIQLAIRAAYLDATTPK